MENKITINRVRLAFMAAFVFVGFFLLATYSNMRKAESESRNVKSALDVLLRLENILVDIQAIETGQRGFTISGNSAYLSSYYQGLNSIRKDTTILAQLQLTDSTKAEERSKLLLLLNKKIAYSRVVVETRRIYGYDSAALNLQATPGKILMDSIENTISSIAFKDRKLLQQSNLDREKFARLTTWQFLVLSILFFVILYYSYRTIIKEYIQTEKNEKALKFNASLVQNISDPIITTDNQDKITNWNSYAEKLYGYTEAEVLGKEIDSILQVPLQKEPEKSSVPEALAGSYLNRESVHHHKNGAPIDVDVSISAIQGLAGEVVGTVGVIRDITQRKNTERQLQQVMANLQQLVNTKVAELNSVFERITDAFIALDNEWNYTYLNKKAAELHAVLPEDLIGKNIWEQFPEVIEEPFYAALHLAKETQQPQRLQLYSASAGKWFEDLIYPSANGMSVYYHDITVRKNAEISLAKIHEKLSYHIKNTPMGVIEFDKSFKILQWNELAEQIFGWTEEEALAGIVDVYHLMSDEDRVNTQEKLKALADTGINNNVIQNRFVTKRGRLISCDWYNSVLRDEEGNTIGIMSIVQDVTDRKKYISLMEASARDLQMSNERFLLVAKATEDAVWDWDMQADIIWGNESFRNIFKLAENEDFNFEQFLGCIHKEDKDSLLHNFRNSLDQKQSLVTEEFRFKTKDETFYRTLYDKAYILYNEQDTAYRMLGAMQDVTAKKEYENKLVLEKELSDSIINSLPGIFYLFNKQGEYYRWNKNMETVTGYSGDEIKNLHPLDFFKAPEKDMINNKIENVFKVGEDNIEANFVSKDGHETPYYFTGMVINYEGETCLMGVGIDISERIKSQKKLKESEEKYRALVEQASDGIFISNQAGDYLDVNSSASLLTGYSKEELLKLNLRDIVLKEELKENPLRLEEILSGKVVLNERFLKQKNGHPLQVEISAKLLADGRFQALVRDITQRKKAEEALRLSEQKYRLLFNQNPMPMWMISVPERNFLDVNPAAIAHYGYSKTEFLNMNVRDIRPEQDRKKMEEALATFPTGINNAGVWLHKKKDGTLIQVNIITHDINYEGREAKLVLANDLTEKIKAEENLKKSHEELRQLAANLENIRENERTHMAREIHDELGQQLTGLKMDISWLNKKIHSPDDEINQKIKDTIQLIDQTVITVRRIATQLRPSILDDLGLIAAMEWQSEEFQKRALIRSSFTTNLQNPVIKTELATAVFRIFQESLTNVLRHAEATAVTTSLMFDKENLTLTITDYGKGFNEQEIAQKKTLGLLGMRERTLLMGGKYEISGKPGVGTTVRIIVPLK
ncbi:MAG: PAS domain S-box protein [Ferruginibacter sp.]